MNLEEIRGMSEKSRLHAGLQSLAFLTVLLRRHSLVRKKSCLFQEAGRRLKIIQIGHNWLRLEIYRFQPIPTLVKRRVRYRVAYSISKQQ
jgi:hypothetical protein